MQYVSVEFAVGDVATLPDCLRRERTPSPRAVQRSARRSLRSSSHNWQFVTRHKAGCYVEQGRLLRGIRQFVTP